MSPETGAPRQEPRIRSVNAYRVDSYGHGLRFSADRLLADRPVVIVYDDFSAFDVAISPHAGHYALSVNYHGKPTQRPLATVAWSRGSGYAARRLLSAFELRRGHDRGTIARLLTDLGAEIDRQSAIAAAGLAETVAP